MANSDKPNGFTPSIHLGGGTIRAASFEIAYDYTTAIFSGDAVVLSSGKVNKATDSSAAILGVFAGCKYRNDSGEVVFSPYWPGVALSDSNAVVEAMVYTDPQIGYEVQCDTGTAFAKTMIGNSYDIELDHAGSTLTGRSGMELDLSDTGTGQFTVVSLVDRPDNAVGVNAKVIVVNNVPAL